MGNVGISGNGYAKDLLGPYAAGGIPTINVVHMEAIPADALLAAGVPRQLPDLLNEVTAADQGQILFFRHYLLSIL